MSDWIGWAVMLYAIGVATNYILVAVLAVAYWLIKKEWPLKGAKMREISWGNAMIALFVPYFILGVLIYFLVGTLWEDFQIWRLRRRGWKK